MELDIFASCTTYDVNILNCSFEIAKQLKETFCIEEDETIIRLSKSIIDSLDIPVDAIDWDSYEVDYDILYGILEGYLGNHPYYLVFAKNCRWNGASGYMFCNELLKTVSRNYDINLIVSEEGTDAIKCIESSHDVPTGAPTYIIGISYDEYEKLEDADFEDICKFAESKF